MVLLTLSLCCLFTLESNDLSLQILWPVLERRQRYICDCAVCFLELEIYGTCHNKVSICCPYARMWKQVYNEYRNGQATETGTDRTTGR